MAARSLANIFNKGLATFPAATSTASVSFYQSILRLSTAVPNDPDTREDFRPSDKIQNSGPSLNEIVEKVNSLLVTPDAYFGRQRKYMKGMPEYPQCGFSVLAVKVLREYKVPIDARNVLRDLEL